MERHPLYGKRKKKKVVSSNPLFIQWLTEWRDEAAEKGLKSQYTYGKALKTLKKFPLKIASGKECKILENFGDKICKMLDDKLTEYITMYGTTEPIHIDDDNDDNDDGGGRNKSGPATSTSNHTGHGDTKKGCTKVKHKISTHDLSDYSEDEKQQQQPVRKRQRSGPSNKEYIPVYRSGPYALLMTLHNDTQCPDSVGYLNKSDLTRKAQPLTDTSFTLADPGCRYTGWSSMGTLIKKGLVMKEGNPARYSLTESGSTLAYKLESAQIDINKSCDSTSNHSAASDVTSISQDTTSSIPDKPNHQIRGNTDRSNIPQRIDETTRHDVSQQRTTVESSRLQYCYVREDGTDTKYKDEALVSIDDILGVGFLIKCNYTELIKSGMKYKLDFTRPLGDDFVYAYISNENAVEIPSPQTGFSSKLNTCVSDKTKAVPMDNIVDDMTSRVHDVNNKTSELSDGINNVVTIEDDDSNESLPCLNDDDDDDNTVKSASNLTKSTSNLVKSTSNTVKSTSNTVKSTSNTVKSTSNSVKSISNTVKSTSNAVKSTSNAVKCTSNSVTQAPNSVNSDVENISLFDRLRVKNQQPDTGNTDIYEDSSQNSIKSISSISSTQSSTLSVTPVVDFILYPGEFDIILCIDNAEYYGASKGSSKTLLPDLIKNGIDCDLRKLHVGDILWIAKERSKPRPGQLERPQGRELVLNYIIERKRMDDLVSSCIDGRYKEQKFRLKQCGLQFPMYLIEDHGSMQHFSLPESTILQTITNTQVIDGFKIKRTKDCKESVAFLTVFTRYLQSHFKDKTLYGCGLERLKENSPTVSINDKIQYLATFEEFNKGSVKSKALTIHEMFGKQLIQVYGMSAEKATSVIKQYATPSHLFEAYNKLSTTHSKENLLCSIKCGKSQRSFGSVQSRQIYQLYNTETVLK